MFTVFLRSEEFGYEEFRYDTLDEALAGIGRLASACVTEGDGVEREIGIKINKHVNHECDEG